jgi:hypothetical protein
MSDGGFIATLPFLGCLDFDLAYDFRFGAGSSLRFDAGLGRRCTSAGLLHCGKEAYYSITSASGRGASGG